MSACARHNQRSNSTVLNRRPVTGLLAGPFPLGVPGSGEFRLHRLPGHRAELHDTLIFVFASHALLRTFPLSPVSPRLPAAPLSSSLHSSLAVPSGGAGPARQLPGPRPAFPQPHAPEPPGLILRLGEAPQLAHHPTDSPLGSGQSPPDLGRRRPWEKAPPTDTPPEERPHLARHKSVGSPHYKLPGAAHRRPPNSRSRDPRRAVYLTA